MYYYILLELLQFNREKKLTVLCRVNDLMYFIYKVSMITNKLKSTPLYIEFRCTYKTAEIHNGIVYWNIY